MYRFFAKGRQLNRAGILAVTYGGGHARAVKPVCDELYRRKISVVVLALTTGESIFQDAPYRIIGFRHIIPDVISADVQRLGATLASAEGWDSAVGYAETVAYLGLNMYELIQRVGEEAAHDLFRRHSRRAFNPEATMKRLLNQINPRIVLTTTSPRSEKAALFAAAKLDIPSVMIVESLYNPVTPWVADHNVATKRCVLNNSVAEELIGMNGRLIPSSVIVTGGAGFTKRSDVVCNRSGVKNRILFCGFTEPEKHNVNLAKGNSGLELRLLKVLDELVDTLGIEVLVKQHPSEVPTWNQVVKHCTVLDRNADVTDYFSEVDCVVTMPSMVCVDAMINDATVILVKGSVFDNDLPYFESGLASLTVSESDLFELIVQLYKAESFGEIVSSSSEIVSGPTAANNIADVVQSLFGSG